MSIPTDAAATVPTVNAAETTASGGGGDNVTLIITVAACIGGLFLIILIVFIIFVIYFYRKQIKEEDEFDRKGPSSLSRADRLDWKSHSLAHQFGNINDIDEILWTDGGRVANAETDNPAFGQDFEPLDVNNLKAFDSMDEDAASTRETESTSEMVEINMDDDEDDKGDDPGSDDGTDAKDVKQISILDMKTWGQPGSSRRNSMRSVHGFAPPPSFDPRPPDAISHGGHSLRSQSGNPFPYASTGSLGRQSDGGFPFTVSQPANDPRFEYTRTNPLLAGAGPSPPGSTNTFPFAGAGRGYNHEQRDFGGADDIESTEFDRSSTLRRSGRNQSVVDFYESGTRTTGSSFSLSLEGNNSVGKNLLWQNKKFGGMMGFANTK